VVAVLVGVDVPPARVTLDVEYVEICREGEDVWEGGGGYEGIVMPGGTAMTRSTSVAIDDR